MKRPEIKARFPVHVTLRLGREVGALRNGRAFGRVRRAFLYGHDRFGMRVTEFSIQHGHVHLIVEAEDRRALGRGIKGLCVRIARALNKLVGRRGRVFSDRYHAHILKTLQEVRRALDYVLRNAQKHLRERGGKPHPWWLDPYSSASGEATWCVDFETGRGPPVAARVVAAARTWMLKGALAAWR